MVGNNIKGSLGTGSKASQKLKDAQSILELQESIPDLQEFILALQESIGASQVLILQPEEGILLLPEE